MDKIHFDPTELREAWKKYQTSAEVAKFYGCHKNTILKYSKKLGIPMKLGPKDRATARHSLVSRFFATFEGELPKTIEELAKMIGCSSDTVRNYAYRRRYAAKQALSQQPWRHTGPPVVWTDIKGVRIPDVAFDVVRAFVSRYGQIRFEVRLKTKTVHVFKMPESTFRKLYNIKVDWKHG